MAYPVPLLYNDDRNARRDYDYMKSIYPDTAKRVLPYMEEGCAAGSMIRRRRKKRTRVPGLWIWSRLWHIRNFAGDVWNIERYVKKYIDLQEGIWKKTSTSPSCVLYCAVINECFQMKKSEHNIQEGTSWQIITLFLSECRQSGKWNSGFWQNHKRCILYTNLCKAQHPL